MEHVPDTFIVGAAVLAGWLVTVGTCLAVGIARPRWRPALIAAAVFGLVFQVGHFAEHAAQAGYWVTHQSQTPWMTPWANALAGGFGTLAPGTPGFGMEALHLVGNSIFLVGATATLDLLARSAQNSSVRLARTGVWVQTIHVLEHVALTVSVIVTGRAIGLSTMFGTLGAGPGLSTYRIWWHLTINATATALIVVAVARRHHQQTGAVITNPRALATS